MGITRAFVILAIGLISCDSRPKVIVADEAAPTQITPTATGNTESGGSSMAVPAGTSSTGGVHQVVANEVLQADRYTYLNVTEGNRTFWIATSKTEASRGKTYLYKDGLMKTNFESVEFKRTFDTIYLISHVIDASQHPGGTLSGNIPPSGSVPQASNGPGSAQSGNVVKIADLFKNKSNYKDKVIAVSGTAVKVNNGIMGRNWVHIEDGSGSGGKNQNLTVTTSMNIPLGSKVTLRGTIALDKDFGAGYRYDVIMENANN